MQPLSAKLAGKTATGGTGRQTRYHPTDDVHPARAPMVSTLLPATRPSQQQNCSTTASALGLAGQRGIGDRSGLSSTGVSPSSAQIARYTGAGRRR